MAKKDVTLNFKFEKSTSGAHRFFEVDDKGEKKEMADATIGTLYLRKSAIGDKAPNGLNITIKQT